MASTVNSFMVSPPKKTKKKFKNAEAARQHRLLEAEWLKLNDRWQPLQVKAVPELESYVPVKDDPPRETGNKNLKSLDVWVTGTLSKKDSPVYSGTKLKGVSVLHKSNGVPVFSDEEIIDIARMRR